MLIYTGNGAAIVGIPARDLSDAEVEANGGEANVLATGLYTKPASSKATKQIADPVPDEKES